MRSPLAYLLVLTATVAARAEEGSAPAAPAGPRWFGFAEDVVDGEVAFGELSFSPYATVVGGVHGEVIDELDESAPRADRLTTLALARFGLHAGMAPYLSIHSELEVNAGPYGTSVWEGQAALQVRDQLLRLALPELVYDDELELLVGRLTDAASVNYFSEHAANLLLTDDIARTPLLIAGFNRGNGVAVGYRALGHLHVGLTLNAGNPTSTTGTLMMGGTFPPFSRFYEVPHAHVGRDARGFPLASFHVMLLSPSVRFESEWLRAQASVQLVEADTNTNTTKDAPLRGVNVRGGASLRLFDDLGWDNGARAFVNASRIVNDVVDPDDLARLGAEPYEAMVLGGGLDVDVLGASGLGLSYDLVREREPGRPPLTEHFVNLGATLWLHPTTSVSARVALTQRCYDVDCDDEGTRAAWLTARTTLGADLLARP